MLFPVATPQQSWNHPMTIRRLSLTDKLFGSAQRAVQVLTAASPASRPNPAGPYEDNADAALSRQQRQASAGMMRVNHVGEICAQALYEGQGLVARSYQIRAGLSQAAIEERDHLAWTAERLRELDARPSLLNPLWYGASFGMGLLAGRLGDRASMGFMMETERQVEHHLEGHLAALPAGDERSRAIVAQMKLDEAEHGATARQLGASKVPAPVRLVMQGVAKVMTTTARWI